LTKPERKYQRRGNVIRGIPKPPNKYLFGRQPKFNHNLGVGYLVVLFRNKTIFDRRDPEFEQWLVTNHLKPRIRPYHVSLCYESWEEMHIVAAVKRGPRSRHVDQAYPPKTWPKIFVLKPTKALTLTQAQLLAHACQWYAVRGGDPNPFAFIENIIQKVFPERVIKNSPIDFVMDPNYIVDHSIHWESKSSINL